ncbi:MAG: DUF4342 domain-containing protein [Scytonematopsis contorta HA4267-MV1]|jgi:hypothetical protein|nr:DUF4342 domain-containing protein [Scytonematopsis contorta HA4267-MV1]
MTDSTNINLEPATDEGMIITTDNTKTKTRIEEISVGNDLVADIQKLIEEVNVRRITIKNQDGYTLLDVPLSVGAVGGAIGVTFFPALLILGGLGTVLTHMFVTRLKIVVEREE